MPFQQILDQIAAVRGVEAVVFLDAEGETILSAGRDEAERLRLIGAHQSILLTTVKRMGLDGPQRTLISLYDKRIILTHHLKDGYFISVIFSGDVNFAHAHFRFSNLYKQMEEEL